MRRLWGVIGVYVLALLATVFSSTVPVRADGSSPVSQAVISEIKLGGATMPSNIPPKEYVSIFNVSGSPLDVSGWRLEYAKSSYNQAQCSSVSWSSNSVSGSANTVALSGVVPAGSFLVFERSMNDAASGSLRIIDMSNVVHDLVGWGSSAPCYESQPTAIPKNDKSLQRYLKCTEQVPLDSDDNSVDFAADQIPSPTTLAIIRPASCNTGGGTGPNEPVPTVSSNCEGVIISEVLPNPGGSDTGKEFIELYNPTSSAINLQNCKLQTSASDDAYIFPAQTIGAKSHKAFFDSVTGLTLPNSAGGTVWLLDHEDAELSEANYAEDLDDDVSWTYVNNKWQVSYTVTPGTSNVAQPTKPCPEGQIRNLETNRCNNIAAASAGLVPCAPGKERNPLTNRCRSSASTLSALKACAADQFRNPETNRCKKIASAAGLKPCEPGQARNPETNRCRKIAGAGTSGSIGKITDIPAPLVKNTLGWWLAAATITGAIAYGLFEWRNEIGGGLQNFKAKFVASAN